MCLSRSSVEGGAWFALGPFPLRHHWMGGTHLPYTGYEDPGWGSSLLSHPAWPLLFYWHFSYFKGAPEGQTAWSGRRMGCPQCPVRPPTFPVPLGTSLQLSPASVSLSVKHALFQRGFAKDKKSGCKSSCNMLSKTVYLFPTRERNRCSSLSRVWLFVTSWTVTHQTSVRGILQAGILQWIAIPFCKGSSQPRDWTWVSCIAGKFFTPWAIREALKSKYAHLLKINHIQWNFYKTSSILKVYTSYHLFIKEEDLKLTSVWWVSFLLKNLCGCSDEGWLLLKTNKYLLFTMHILSVVLIYTSSPIGFSVCSFLPGDKASEAAFPLKQCFSCYCSITKSYLTLCNPMDCSMPGFPVLHHLSEFAQTHVHWVSDAIQPSHPLSSPSPPALNLSQHQGLSNESAVYISIGVQLQYQSFQWLFRVDSVFQRASANGRLNRQRKVRAAVFRMVLPAKTGARAAASSTRSTCGHGRWAESFPRSWGPIEHDSWNPAQDSRDAEPRAQTSAAPAGGQQFSASPDIL